VSPFKKKLKARDRGANRRCEAIIVAVVKIFAKGEPTKFAFVDACRHGLRSQLCLDGYAWAAADKFAAAIVEETRCAGRRIASGRDSVSRCFAIQGSRAARCFGNKRTPIKLPMIIFRCE
jgi:hypothetical protein